MKYVNQQSDIMGGVPVMTGTRIPISRIFQLVGQGYSFERISTEVYPWIEPNQIAGSVSEFFVHFVHPYEPAKKASKD